MNDVEQPLLRVDNLQVSLREPPVALVKHVSFEIAAGEIFALVGESGSGKSLTALSILRLLPDALSIDGGSVIFNEQGQDNNKAKKDLFDLPEMAMNTVRGRKVAMIFQEPQSSLNPVQTIEQQLAEILELHQELERTQARQRIIELLDEVGIPDPEKRLGWYPHQLSGGQKQRVMIAMALACEPELLIADEPTTALDVTIQKQVLELIQQLCERRNLSVLLITHDMGVVYALADKVAVMRHGEIVEQGNKGDFFQAPQHPYSRELIESLPDTSRFLTADESTPLLELDDIKVWFPVRKGLLQRVYDYTRAVDGVSLTIQQGESLALVGESGCGKTTLGRAILRLADIYAGQIKFSGRNISALADKEFADLRKEIQIIFQDPFSSMNPRMTVRSILEEGLKSLEIDIAADQRSEYLSGLLEKVGLQASHLDRFPHEFSGGQRQRIAIARALAVKPKLIICDEPTSALDVSIRGQVIELLKRLQQEEGITYLFITHDLSLIPSFASRVVIMKQGKLIEQGSTEEIFNNPQQDYTRELLSSIYQVSSFTG